MALVTLSQSHIVKPLKHMPRNISVLAFCSLAEVQIIYMFLYTI